MKFTVDKIELTEEQAKLVAEQYAARPGPTKKERIGGLTMADISDMVVGEAARDNSVVVRLRRSYWSDNRGIHQRTDLTYMNRKTSGHNFVREDVSCIGADELFLGITNVDECGDGLYEVVMTNVSRDWETGYVDSYDYELVPHIEDEED